ncbi:RING-H2 finger protein [Salix suchowensis]|nr:RING-H2 finger protein [Salix suchowensis]
MSHLTDSISSYDSNIMLAAVISLLVAILFVLLLHIYAKWFLAQARNRRRSSSVTASHVLRPSRFHHLHNFTIDTTFSPSTSKGLDTSVISSIPLFVYKAEECKQGLECVICLSPFEENEAGRSLTKCGHGFHVECIDTWLNLTLIVQFVELLLWVMTMTLQVIMASPWRRVLESQQMRGAWVMLGTLDWKL